MLYGYDTYDNYPPYEYAQPLPELDIHPNLAAAQLGLTPEQIREVVEEQERWDREFQQELEEEERARVSAQHQEQEQHQDEARWVPTPSVSDFDPTPQAYEVPDEPPKNATSPYNDGPLDPEPAPHLLYQPPTPTSIALHPPLPPYDGTYEVTGECDEYVTTVVDDAFDANNANMEPEHDGVMEQLVHELVVPGDTGGSWAEDMDMGLGLGPQGEYTPTNYPPSPSSASPAPLHQPHALNTMGHLDTCPPHSKGTMGPLTGLISPTSATPETGETSHPIKTSQLEAEKAQTARTGVHPVPTAPPHSGVIHHLPNHHLPRP